MDYRDDVTNEERGSRMVNSPRAQNPYFEERVTGPYGPTEKSERSGYQWEHYPTTASYGGYDDDSGSVPRPTWRTGGASMFTNQDIHIGHDWEEDESEQVPRGYGGSLTVRPQTAPTRGYTQPAGRRALGHEEAENWAESAPGAPRRQTWPSPEQQFRREAGQVGATGLRQEVIADLNASIAAEAMAAYRYLYLSKWLEGANHRELSAFFADTSREQWNHVACFMERVIELGGSPVASPTHWERLAYGRYAVPPLERHDTRRAIEDSIRSEEQALRHYEQLAEKTMGRDHLTYHLAVAALRDEVRDLEQLGGYLH